MRVVWSLLVVARCAMRAVNCVCVCCWFGVCKLLFVGCCVLPCAVCCVVFAV